MSESTVKKERISVLGSTGSIGVSALSVIRQHEERFEIYGLSANKNAELLLEQCKQYRPRVVVVSDAKTYEKISEASLLNDLAIELLYGQDGLRELVSSEETDTIVAGIAGAAGLESTYNAIIGGKKILVANKEPLVMAGGLLTKASSESGAIILPIDSEHNAILQCLGTSLFELGEHPTVEKIFLTASGGPFLRRPIDTFHTITPEEALRHPTWTMGRKISVDSATMMNKGLEVIEAKFLFSMSPEQIEVIVHPKSLVHSLVQFIDGSTIAQLANPDMSVPISFALAYPERIKINVPQLDPSAMGSLEFYKPDFGKFPCLSFAYDALESGGDAMIRLNASNEIGVQAFLDGVIGFTDIAKVVACSLEQSSTVSPSSVEEILCQDAAARAYAREYIARTS